MNQSSALNSIHIRNISPHPCLKMSLRRGTLSISSSSDGEKPNSKSPFYPIKLIIPPHPGRATPSILIICCHVPSVLHYYPQWCLQYFIKITYHRYFIKSPQIDPSVLINLPPQGCILINWNSPMSSSLRGLPHPSHFRRWWLPIDY